MNCEIIKNCQSPNFYINLPFSGLFPLSYKKNCCPKKTQVSDANLPPFNKWGYQMTSFD